MASRQFLKLKCFLSENSSYIIVLGYCGALYCYSAILSISNIFKKKGQLLVIVNLWGEMFPIVSIFPLLAPDHSRFASCQSESRANFPVSASFPVRQLRSCPPAGYKGEIFLFRKEKNFNILIFLTSQSGRSLWCVTVWLCDDVLVRRSPTVTDNSDLWDGGSFLTLSKVAQCCADQTLDYNNPSTTMWAGLPSGPGQH